MNRSLIRFLFIQFLLPLLINAYQYELSVATIFRDDAPYLKEWLEYHQMQGVEHFYLYNNLSEDEYQEVLLPYIQKGLVELIDWPLESDNLGQWNQIQVKACNDALKKAAGETKWLAIIDSDEFIVPTKHLNLKTLLASYEHDPKLGGICLMWVFYGTSNIPTIPKDKLMLELLTLNGGLAAGGNIDAVWKSGCYKSIVRPERVSIAPSPHYCKYVPGYSHVMIDANTGLINHYWTRDEHYFYNYKIPLREKWGTSANTCINWAKGMSHRNQYSETMLPFIPELKKRMDLPQ